MTPEEKDTLIKYLELENKENAQYKHEAVYWKQVAAYIAQCEMGSVEYFTGLKSVSAYQKKRLLDVAKVCESLLLKKEMPRQYGSSPDYADDKVKDAANRATEFIAQHK